MNPHQLGATRANLDWLRRHYTTIEAHLAPHNIKGEGSRPKPTSRPPLNTAALSLVQRGGLAGQLGEWVKIVVEQRHINPPNPRLCDADYFTATTQILRTHLDWAAEQDWFAELHKEVAGLRRSVEFVCGLVNEAPIPGDRKACVLDRTITIDGIEYSGRCGGQLWQNYDDDVIYCRRTPEHVWAKNQWLHLGRLLRETA